jgi:OOP family OmpA-OmpF porin
LRLLNVRCINDTEKPRCIPEDGTVGLSASTNIESRGVNMSASVFSSLFNLLDSSSINEIAGRLGEPGQAVSRGLESSTASLISSLAGRSSDPNSMSQIFDLVAHAPSEINVSNLASAVTGSGDASASTASLLDSGKKFLSLAVGANQSSFVDAISRSAVLRGSSATSLVSIAAPLLMTALGRLVRSDRLTQGQLGSVLVYESAGIQNLLPPEMQHRFERTVPAEATPDLNSRPLSISTVPEPRPSLPAWLWLLAVLLLIPLLLWLFNREHVRQGAEATQAATERSRLGAADLGEFVIRKLPGNVDLSVPQLGVESRLLAFIQDPSKNVDEVTWFDFDRLLFNTDSAQLRPESQEQLRNIAAILAAYPHVHIKVGGYTDNTGDAQSNLKLSQDRADGVVAELISLGVEPNRLESQGYGDEHPVAGNSTEEGRARNRRISMSVTEK